MSEEVQITIIGGGVIGCAVAYELSKDSRWEDLVVIEKNNQIKGENQSSRNSGVIHAGIYYPKNIGPLKARLCVEGNRLLYEFCAKHDIPCKKTGKLVVATDSMEEEYLEDVYSIGVSNNVPDIEIMDGKRAKLYEPNIKVVSALYVPSSGIVDATSLVDRLYRYAESAGAMFLTGNKVIDIKPGNGGFEIKIASAAETETFKTRYLINAAGLYSDEIAEMVNLESPYLMDTVKGEYARFYKSKRENIFMKGLNVYPVPCGYLPGGEKLKVTFKEFQRQFMAGKVNKSVGVHLTPTFDIRGSNYIIGDTVTIGPAYSKPQDKEDYRQERKEKYYLEMVKPFFPNLALEDISLHQAGIRSKLKDWYDFVIERDPGYPDLINLVGIDSPGLTSSLAISKYVKKLLQETL